MQQILQDNINALKLALAVLNNEESENLLSCLTVVQCGMLWNIH